MPERHKRMSEEVIRVLLIEDNPGDARLIQELLAEASAANFTLDCANELSAGLRRLAKNDTDVVLLDLGLPDSQGLDTFTTTHDQVRNVPIVVLTGLDDETLATRAMRAGAQDYLAKGNMDGDLLTRTIRYAIERKRAAKALRQSEARFRNLVETTSDWVWEVDKNGVLTYVSPKVRDILGYEPDELLGKTPFDTMPPEEANRAAAIVGTYTATQKPFHLLENTRAHKDGHRVVLETSGVPIFDADGTFDGYHGIDRDITERKLAEEEKQRLEAQIQYAERMEAIGTLAGGIAHDFNNLLMAIKGNVALILMDTDPKQSHHDKLKNINSQVESGARLTKQLLGYASKGMYEVKLIDLNHLIKHTTETFGRTRREITIRQELTEGLLAMEADEGQIEQVLLNLYVNAADAMPTGGELILKTMNVTHRDMKTRLCEPSPGNYVLLQVTDTGTGMDEETRGRVFEPFFTTKEMGRGTGLGLASVYGIVKGHGGHIDLESEEGYGATFRIYLPASEKKLRKAVEITDEIIMGSGTILVVDDEPMVLNINVQLLEKHGYSVLEASGGREAVEVYQANKDVVDLVILDMIMPDMGGGEAYDKMKEINPNVKVLLSSGYSIDGQATEILKRGCDGFIQKPFAMKDLYAKIGEILHK
jgi:PAS domain S-box-containing protein